MASYAVMHLVRNIIFKDKFRGINLFNTERKNERGEIEIAICPLCGLRVEFMGAPMVRCYSTGETYERTEVRWIEKSKVPEGIGYDVENIRGNDSVHDFLPNAHLPVDEIEA
jgi:hypothetical protein